MRLYVEKPNALITISQEQKVYKPEILITTTQTQQARRLKFDTPALH